MTIKRLLILPGVLTGWIAVLMAVTIFSDEAPAVVVMFPQDTFIQNLPDDIGISGATPYSVTLSSDRPGFAISLYERGARIVLPAGLAGCFRGVS